MTNRREFLTRTLGAVLASTSLSRAFASSQKKQRVVVVGGGFAGAKCATQLRRLSPSLDVVLIEPKRHYTACPMSNMVLIGERPLSQQVFTYDGVAKQGVSVVHAYAEYIDTEKQHVVITGNTKIYYDKVVVCPGIDFRWGTIEGFEPQNSQVLPHAWQAGQQTQLLAQQVAQMRAGGTLVITVPGSPYRCPPGPYERASLFAHYFSKHNPKAKILILDGKDSFSKQPLFLQAWKQLYGDMIQWQGLSDGANVIAVNAKSKTIETDFDSYHGDVINLIGPQQAGRIARVSGLTDSSGWCPVVPTSFASRLADHTYVIGDAAIANGMPKSAFSANAQAKLCAQQVVRSLRGEPAVDSKMINTCYSLAAPDYGISVAQVYQATDTLWQPVKGAGGMSELSANQQVREAEAQYAYRWFNHITGDTFVA